MTARLSTRRLSQAEARRKYRRAVRRMNRVANNVEIAKEQLLRAYEALDDAGLYISDEQAAAAEAGIPFRVVTGWSW